MKKVLAIVIMAIICVTGIDCIRAVGQQSYDDMSNRDILDILDRMIAGRGAYYEQRKSKADSLKRILLTTELTSAQLPLYLERGQIWSGISSDSAIAVYNEGLGLSRELGDRKYEQLFRIYLSQSYFHRGQLVKSITDLKNLSIEGIENGVEVPFNHVTQVVCYVLGHFYPDNDNVKAYLDTGLKHAREELKYIKSDSVYRKYCEGQVYLGEGKWDLMAEKMFEVIREAPADEKYRGLAYTLIGEYNMRRGEYDEAVRYYALGAIDDIRLANLDEVSLLRLGELLNKMGDTSRAHNYMTVSLENAIKGDMKFNLMRINDAYTDVTETIDREKHGKVSMLSGLVIVLVGLLLLVAKMTVDKRREVKHLRAVEQKLASANLAKETYIGEFMNLCSSYIESLEDYNRMSKRKITAGQTDELLAYIKSGKIIEEQRAKFYDVFDDAFLHIFPDYVKDVNRLLQPDKQIVTPSPQVLNTELRILALSRLGIDDAGIIARFLGITTNTIYTYRNKLRTRAINRTTFEDDARKIGLH
ncbi:MAG: hypothetical protein K2J94_03930 [Duncaniella sp.]|nr:hypothetical protein [Duncaniella sp.]